MPTYEYRCAGCGHEFEEFQSITASSLKKCPACGKNKLKRLIGMGAGIIFKGSGFYETDYRSDSYKKDAKADSDKSTPKAEPAKTETKSEIKSESKSESTPTKSEPKPAATAKTKK